MLNLNLMNLEKPNDEIIIIRDSYICRLSFRSRLLLVPRGQFTTQLFLFLYLKKKKSHTYERTYGRPRALRDVLEVGFI